MRLTRDEIILITCVLLALAVGAVVKSYRDHLRLTRPQPVASPTKPMPGARRTSSLP